MERTGHRSIKAVRSYKRPSVQQLEQVSDILNNGYGHKRPCTDLVNQPVSINTCAQPDLQNFNLLTLGYTANTAITHMFKFTSCSSITIRDHSSDLYVGMRVVEIR